VKNPDVIIIGGGHNGLICSGYLARAGLEVLLLEASDRVGGPAATREFFPGFSSSIANSPGSLEPKILADFELEKHGLRFVRPDPTLVHPLPEGRLFVGWRERERVDAQIDSYAPGESKRYHAVFDYLNRFAERLGISVFREPPTLQELTRNLRTVEDEEMFSRIFFGSVRGLFEHFDLAPETQAIMGPLSVVSGLVGPSTPGTPFNLMMRPLSLASLKSETADDPRRMPLRGSTGLAVGAMGAIADAMARSVEASGVKILREARVTSIEETKQGLAVPSVRRLWSRPPILISRSSSSFPTIRSGSQSGRGWLRPRRPAAPSRLYWAWVTCRASLPRRMRKRPASLQPRNCELRLRWIIWKTAMRIWLGGGCRRDPLSGRCAIP
jgi:phytoene dehydrogenase-like protein